MMAHAYAFDKHTHTYHTFTLHIGWVLITPQLYLAVHTRTLAPRANVQILYADLIHLATDGGEAAATAETIVQEQLYTVHI